MSEPYRYGIHKARPQEDGQHCAVCGQRVKRVEGGIDRTWIHADSGAVTAPDPPAEPRFTAHFTPEAWMRDQAVEVDAPGPQEWDCTGFLLQHLHYLVMLGLSGDLDRPSGATDIHDLLRDDPAAPAWIHAWHGPFTIRVRQEPGQ